MGTPNCANLLIEVPRIALRANLLFEVSRIALRANLLIEVSRIALRTNLLIEVSKIALRANLLLIHDTHSFYTHFREPSESQLYIFGSPE